MNGVAWGLLGQAALAVCAVVVAVTARGRVRAVLAGVSCALLAAAGAATGGLALGGGTAVVRIPTALPTPPLVIAPDRLGGVLMLLVGAVGVLASLYAIGYVHGAAASRTQWVALALFLLGMQLVPAAGDVVSFLLAWELMAAASTVLVVAEHVHRRTAREAAVWYAVTTHLSFVLILAGFAALSAAGGATSFAALTGTDPTRAGTGVAFVLLVVGFAAKAGLAPLHVWLPRAHPEAPSHASALMSAAMVSLGAYGILLVGIRLLPGGPTWWAVLLVVLGAGSAVYGILHASVATDLKRLLAYSTSENLGLVVAAIGLTMLLRTHHVPGAASAALVAALLLLVSHAAFKATLFLGAGAVLRGTGERDLDRMGGLVHTMPWTAATFGVGSLGAAALPVTGGFVAEWALLQALIHGVRPTDRVVAVVVPLTLGLIALTAGLALVTFVKAFGIAFLARARSAGTLGAREVPVTMRVALVLGAGTVLALGVLPGPVAAALAAAAGLTGGDGARATGLGGVALTGVGAVLSPAALTGLGAVVALPALVAMLVAARRRPATTGVLGWGCGGVRTDPRMQYNATSYAEPVTRIFDDALRPSRDVVVTHVAESAYLAERVRFAQHVDDVVEARLYRPLVTAADAVADRARRVQNGSINRYLAFSFTALVVVLLVVVA